MKFLIYNRFKFIVGCIFAISIMLYQPALANVQDSTENVAVEESAEAVSAEADSSAGNEALDTEAAIVDGEDSTATDDEAVASGTSSTLSSTAAAQVTADEGSSIDPQVYINFIYYVILFIVICAIVVIVNRILSIYELTQIMNGRYNPLAGNNLQAILLLVFLVFFLWGVYYSYDVWGRWAFRAAATEHGKKIDVMFIITTIITTFVLVVMHIVIFTFTYIYRMRVNKKAYFYPHNNTLEKIWTVVPATVLTILVLFGFFTWREITNIPEDLQKSAIQIEVLGEQFQWHVRYPGGDGEIGKRNYRMTTPTNPYGIDFTDKNSWDDIQAGDIVIPVNQSVRFHIISKDILHSFYIPDFRVQMNAVPGMTNYFQFTPTITTAEMRDKMDDQSYDFVMLCAKICGTGHYNMQKKVVVVTDEEYKEWLGKQGKYFTEDLQKEFAAMEQEESSDLASTTLN